MRESVIESYLVKRVREVGGIAYKFTSPGRRGVPDRICVFPERVVVFAEVKSPTGVTTPLQDFEIKQLKARGQHAVIINSRPRVDALIAWVCNVIQTKKKMRDYL